MIRGWNGQPRSERAIANRLANPVLILSSTKDTAAVFPKWVILRLNFKQSVSVEREEKRRRGSASASRATLRLEVELGIQPERMPIAEHRVRYRSRGGE